MSSLIKSITSDVKRAQLKGTLREKRRKKIFEYSYECLFECFFEYIRSSQLSLKLY